MVAKKIACMPPTFIAMATPLLVLGQAHRGSSVEEGSKVVKYLFVWVQHASASSDHSYFC